MIKTAIVAEGQTEQIFITAVISHIASDLPYYVVSKRLNGGRRFKTVEIDVHEEGDPEASFYCLVLNCGDDARVVPEINERYDGFVDAGYQNILAVRDLGPAFSRGEVDRALAGFAKTLRSDPLVPDVFFAIMEIEAWFVAEVIHFREIHQSLTPAFILEKTAIDVLGNAHNRDQPASDLNEIYGLVGLTYDKSRQAVERTVGSLSMGEYFGDAAQRAPSIGSLTAKLGQIFAGS